MAATTRRIINTSGIEISVMYDRPQGAKEFSYDIIVVTNAVQLKNPHRATAKEVVQFGVTRSHADVQKLNAAVIKANPLMPLPPVPKKSSKIPFADRVRGIERFLKIAVENERIAHSAPLYEFLGTSLEKAEKRKVAFEEKARFAPLQQTVAEPTTASADEEEEEDEELFGADEGDDEDIFAQEELETASFAKEGSVLLSSTDPASPRPNKIEDKVIEVETIEDEDIRQALAEDTSDLLNVDEDLDDLFLDLDKKKKENAKSKPKKKKKTVFLDDDDDDLFGPSEVNASEMGIDDLSSYLQANSAAPVDDDDDPFS